MKCYKRIIAFFLAFAMSVSLLSAANAAEPSGILEDSASVAAWNRFIASNLLNESNADSAQHAYWVDMDYVLSLSGLGAFETYAEFEAAVYRLNSTSCGYFGKFVDLVVNAYKALFTGTDIVCAYDETLGVWRPYHSKANLWIVNSLGHFPYYGDGVSGEEAGETIEVSERLYHWVAYDNVNWGYPTYVTKYQFDSARTDYGATGTGTLSNRNYQYLYKTSNYATYALYLVDANNSPVAYIADTSGMASGTTNNYYTEEDTTIIEGDTDNSTTIYNTGNLWTDSIINWTDYTIQIPNGDLQYIDSIYYDESSKTYYVDSHDTYTFNEDNDTYITNNYTYNIQYHIDYTSVTYIGQTEEYDEEYRYYYQLPDGRSSADLTAADLEQLSIAFADVVTYARSADDVNMRVLYHFDGSTQDSSYWSYCTDFVWNTGASLTYMDEGTFNGSLYLDETEHDFTIELPNVSDGSGDYTLQFRYYQSYTAAPVTDSYIKLGDKTVLRSDGATWYNASGAALTAVSVGTWNEICLLCSGGTLYYYFNGVPYGTVADGLFSGGTVTFHFGSEQQTYKKLDELRFSRGAIYTPGENYEPTAVPHDTNLTLILPDGERPMADEVMVLKKSENNLLDAVGLSDWSTLDVLGYVYNDPLLYRGSIYNVPLDLSYPVAFDSDFLSFSSSDGATLVDFGGTTSLTTDSTYYYYPANSFAIPVASGSNLGHAYLSKSFGYEFGQTYTLSVVLADGTFSYVTFTPNSTKSNFDKSVSIVTASTLVFEVTRLGNCQASYAETDYGFILSSTTGTAEILYMELVEGTEPQFEITYEMAVYSSGELEAAPILAVRTNQTITGYQIGGVRPSYPEKGQVWAMVENSRITSLQQYTGSAWVQVDGRIWTGERWIPYSSFDVFLLKDCYDVLGTVTGEDYEYIYSESGFWAWWQKQWLSFKDGLFGKLDAIIAALEELTGLEISDETGCQHVYNTETYDATCSDPGHTLYTCTECGYSFTEVMDALGHDWIVKEDIPTTYEMPDGAHCPGCAGTDFTFVINADQSEYTCTCTVCSVEWTETPEVTYGYTLSTCSRCGETQKDSKDPESGFFDALGNFLADGVEWVTDKLTQLVDSLSSINEIFQEYVEGMKDKVGEYPAFLTAVIAVMPQDLMDVIWFGLVAVLFLVVWKKFFS